MVAHDSGFWEMPVRGLGRLRLLGKWQLSCLAAPRYGTCTLNLSATPPNQMMTSSFGSSANSRRWYREARLTSVAVGSLPSAGNGQMFQATRSVLSRPASRVSWK